LIQFLKIKKSYLWEQFVEEYWEVLKGKSVPEVPELEAGDSGG
jgi:hypothetical protein